MLLRSYLKHYHVKQEEFARRVGVTQSAVSMWCSGKKMPNPWVIKKISRASHGLVTLDDLMAACVKSAPKKRKTSTR